MKFCFCLMFGRHIFSDWIERNDDFFDGINLDVNFPVMPQEKLAYFQEFSLVKLLKSPLNLLFDESMGRLYEEVGKKNSKKIMWFANHSRRWIDRMETTKGKSFSWNRLERSISVTSRCCGLEPALFSTPEFRWRMWYDRIIRSIDMHSGDFLNQLGVAQSRVPSVSFPVRVLEVREQYTRSQFGKK